MWPKTLVIGKKAYLLLWWACFRQAGTSAAWCLPSSMWCGPPCFWSAGRGGRLSLHTSGEHWTRPLSPWRNRGLSSGWEELHFGSLSFCRFLFLVVSHVTSDWAGSEALQSHNWPRRVLLSSVAAAPVQVAGQPARVYPVYLLCLPGHAHLLRATGQSCLTKPDIFVVDLMQAFYSCCDETPCQHPQSQPGETHGTCYFAGVCDGDQGNASTCSLHPQNHAGYHCDRV